MRTIVMLGAFALILAESAEAQGSNDLTSGMRVRVTAGRGVRTVGTLTRYSGDTIELSQSKSATGRAQFERKHVTMIEVSRSRRRGAGALKYGILGMLGGGVGGALLGYAAGDGDNGVVDRGGTAAIGGIALGSVGLGLGLVAGAVQGSDRWVPVPPRGK